MDRKCFICGNLKPFFQFPSDPDQRNKWVKSLKRFCSIFRIIKFRIEGSLLNGIIDLNKITDHLQKK
jgi:hypothetical protein